MPKLIMLSGPSGSGKSTLAKELMEADGNMVRLNRDKLREMSILKWKPSREGWIIDAEVALALAAAKSKRNILIDDTNLRPADEQRWKNVAGGLLYTFEVKKMDVDVLTCVERDAQRTGNARIGRPSIERQFLRGGLIKWPEDKQVVIFDIDGTLADLQHRVPWITVGSVCPACNGTWGYPAICKYCEQGTLKKKNHDMFYELVHKDTPIDIVVRWLRACYGEYYVLIVSGRSPENCGEETVTWLHDNDCPFDHIFMRRSFCHGPDTEEKQLILNDLLLTLPKEKIAFVVDDRPSVVAMWKANGLRVLPVRGRDDDVFYEVMNKELDSNPPKSNLEGVLHEGHVS